MPDIKKFVIAQFPTASDSDKKKKDKKDKGKEKKDKKDKGKKDTDQFTDEAMLELTEKAPLIAVFEERPTLITFKVPPPFSSFLFFLSPLSPRFKVSLEGTKYLSAFFQALESNASTLGVSDFQLSMTTLDEVFLKVAHQEETFHKKHRQKNDKYFPFSSLFHSLSLLPSTFIISSRPWYKRKPFIISVSLIAVVLAALLISLLAVYIPQLDYVPPETYPIPSLPLPLPFFFIYLLSSCSPNSRQFSFPRSSFWFMFFLHSFVSFDHLSILGLRRVQLSRQCFRILPRHRTRRLSLLVSSSVRNIFVRLKGEGEEGEREGSYLE